MKYTERQYQNHLWMTLTETNSVISDDYNRNLSVKQLKSLSLQKAKIMGAAQIKEELYNYIEEGDTRLINMLYAVAREYIQEDYTLSGSPMSKETLVNRVRAAKTRIKSDQFTTQEDLENEIEQW